MSYRVGIGYDIHKLVNNRKLLLAGIEIPFPKGLIGHSDADVVLHSVCDALLGALSLGDIGEHFPDTNPKYKGIASTELLKTTYNLIQKKGYAISNIDTVIIAEGPKLFNFKKKMQEKIAKILGIKKGLVNIKAKTNEGLYELGSNKAIASYAVVSVKKR